MKTCAVIMYLYIILRWGYGQNGQNGQAVITDRGDFSPNFTKALLVGGRGEKVKEYYTEVIRFVANGKECEPIPAFPTHVWLATGQYVKGVGATICGGIRLDKPGSRVTDRCYSFDSNRKKWFLSARLSERRFGAASSLTRDGKFWISGGRLARSAPSVAAAEEARDRQAAAGNETLTQDENTQIQMLKTNTTLYLQPGQYQEQDETYGQLNATGQIELGPEIPVEMFRHCQILLTSGSIFFGGGEFTVRCFIYHPDLAYFTEINQLLEVVDAPTCGLVRGPGNTGDEVVVVYNQKAQIYNYEVGRWRIKTELPNFLNSAATLKAGKGFYLLGGASTQWTGVSPESRALDSVYYFDPVAYNWTKQERIVLSTPRRDFIAIVLEEKDVNCKKKGCQTDDDCTGYLNKYCHPESGECVECLADSNCRPKEVCNKTNLTCSCTCSGENNNSTGVNTCPCDDTWLPKGEYSRIFVVGGARTGLVELVEIPNNVLELNQTTNTGCFLDPYPSDEVGLVLVDPVGVLLNGLVIVCGGSEATSSATKVVDVTATCKHYDHKMGKWDHRAGMTQSRTGAAGTMVGRSAWLVTGGKTAQKIITNTTEILIPGIGFKRAALMPGPKAYHCLVTVSPGSVVAIGGFKDTYVYWYGIISDTWKVATSRPEKEGFVHFWSTCGLIHTDTGGTEVLVFENNLTGGAMNSLVSIYSPYTDTWRDGPAIPGKIRKRPKMVQLGHNRLLLVGDPANNIVESERDLLLLDLNIREEWVRLNVTMRQTRYELEAIPVPEWFVCH